MHVSASSLATMCILFPDPNQYTDTKYTVKKVCDSLGPKALYRGIFINQ
jgi:hypothetical protein